LAVLTAAYGVAGKGLLRQQEVLHRFSPRRAGGLSNANAPLQSIEAARPPDVSDDRWEIAVVGLQVLGRPNDQVRPRVGACNGGGLNQAAERAGPLSVEPSRVFSGGLERTDSDAGAEALRAAGYEVFRLPPELKKTLQVEGDDYVEIRGKGTDDDDSRDAMEADVNRILSPFGGEIDSSAFMTIAEMWAPSPARAPNPIIDLAEVRANRLTPF
jgi:hypothetical protein